MDLREIQQLLREGRYEVSFHAQQERLEEDLDLIQIEAAIIDQGELLEEYPDDPEERAVCYWVSLDLDLSMWFWDGPR